MAGQDSLARVAGTPAGASEDVCPPLTVLPPFSEIYRHYFDFVWSSARHLGIGTEGIDDVVQEVFIVIHAKLHTIQQPESLRSWIYGVVRRTVSGHRRAYKVKETSAGSFDKLTEVPGPMGSTPLDAAEQNAQLELLSSLLGEIDEAKREVFILAELEEMTVPEIAEALEIPLNTAYSRLRAARQAFEAGLARRAARPKEKGLR
jgi:RNA polymerase sigma-70 factor (ECF subfamily)